MKRGGKRSRLVGAGVAGTKGGDACVAHGGRGDAMAQQDEGDAHHKASPPTAQPHPRPYGYEGASDPRSL
jgi:hypothetical protein